MNKERVINLRELLHYVLKKWRGILVIAIVLAILAGGYKLNSLRGASNKTESDENIADRMLLTAQLNDLKEDLNSQIEYNRNSIYMKIDPRNEHVATFNLFVTVGNGDMDAEQSALLTSKAVMAYYGYLYSNEFFNYLAENVDEYKGLAGDIRYVKELMWASTELDAGELTYTCIGVTDESVQATIDAARQAIEEKYADIARLVGEHECSIAFDSVNTTTSSSVLKAQNDSIKAVDDYNKAIAEVSAEIDGVKPVQSKTLSRTQKLVRAIKFAVIGGVAGLVLALVFYFICGVLTHKMYGAGAWNECGIPVIGEVYTEKKHRFGAKLDHWIDKLMGCASNELPIEKAGALAAANVLASMKEDEAKSAAIIGAEDKELSNAVVAGMNGVSPDTFVFAGDILTQPEAIGALSGIKEVIILADGKKITVDNVRVITERLSAWGKKLLGVILVK